MLGLHTKVTTSNESSEIYGLTKKFLTVLYSLFLGGIPFNMPDECGSHAEPSCRLRIRYDEDVTPRPLVVTPVCEKIYINEDGDQFC